MKSLLTGLVMAALSAPAIAARPSPQVAGTKQAVAHRLIVLSDIGADPDDTQSMVRLMLYSDEIDLEGLIATTSVWKQGSVSPNLIRRVVEAYSKVQPNLLKHDPRYPGRRAIARVPRAPGAPIPRSIRGLAFVPLPLTSARLSWGRKVRHSAWTTTSSSTAPRMAAAIPG